LARARTAADRHRVLRSDAVVQQHLIKTPCSAASGGTRVGTVAVSAAQHPVFVAVVFIGTKFVLAEFEPLRAAKIAVVIWEHFIVIDAHEAVPLLFLGFGLAKRQRLGRLDSAHSKAGLLRQRQRKLSEERQLQQYEGAHRFHSVHLRLIYDDFVRKRQF